MKRRQIEWILILIVDVAYVAWGAMAAVMPDGLAGPGRSSVQSVHVVAQIDASHGGYRL